MNRKLSTPDEILRAALEKEIQAQNFYGGLAATCPVDFVKELLLTLETEEARHVHMIRTMLDRLGAGKRIV